MNVSKAFSINLLEGAVELVEPLPLFIRISERKIAIKMIKKKNFITRFIQSRFFFPVLQPLSSNKRKEKRSNDIKFIFNICSSFERLIISRELFCYCFSRYCRANAMNNFSMICIFFSFEKFIRQTKKK